MSLASCRFDEDSTTIIQSSYLTEGNQPVRANGTRLQCHVPHVSSSGDHQWLIECSIYGGSSSGSSAWVYEVTLTVVVDPAIKEMSSVYLVLQVVLALHEQSQTRNWSEHELLTRAQVELLYSLLFSLSCTACHSLCCSCCFSIEGSKPCLAKSRKYTCSLLSVGSTPPPAPPPNSSNTSLAFRHDRNN